MLEWVAELGEGAVVLDLASGVGSFGCEGLRCRVVAMDEDAAVFAGGAPRASRGSAGLVGRGEAIPLATASVDLVICSHAFEHFPGLDGVIAEIGRVLKPGGRLYVSVPNGYGLCDGVYRWVFEGGGHVNRLRREELAERVGELAGLRLTRWQKLYTSFAYLHRLGPLLADPSAELSGRLRQLRRLPGWVLPAAQWVLYVGARVADRFFGCDLAVYGWALWFEHGGGDAVESEAYVNVCLKCGQGESREAVRAMSRWRWQCQHCFSPNPFRNWP